MPVLVKTSADGKLMTVLARGKLTRGDYERFVPEVNDLLRHTPKIRVLFEMHNFHGWEPAALWEDIKFDVQHFRDIERLAFVGDRAWESAMAAFCKLFTTAQIRYFDRADRARAQQWIEAA